MRNHMLYRIQVDIIRVRVKHSEWVYRYWFRILCLFFKSRDSNEHSCSNEHTPKNPGTHKTWTFFEVKAMKSIL